MSYYHGKAAYARRLNTAFAFYRAQAETQGEHMEEKPHDFKRGDRVTYIGKNPDLQGVHGTVTFAEMHNRVVQAVSITWDHGECSVLPSTSIKRGDK